MVKCPYCGWSGEQFLSFGIQGAPIRKNARCPSCGSLERHRLLLLYLYLYLEKKMDRSKTLKLLHVAPEKIFINILKSYPNVDYLSVDINPHKAMKKEDITNTSFKDNSFDIIFCIHVLEHIQNDIKAMCELCRILNPEGFAILQVPIEKDLAVTFEDPLITEPAERTKIFGQFDHVRLYGNDYKDRLIKAGFNVEVDKFAYSLSEEFLDKFVPSKENIYFCTAR